jgi:hypothetical protein
MANHLFTSIITDRGRAIVFEPDVAWYAVHRSKVPCVVLFTADGHTYHLPVSALERQLLDEIVSKDDETQK